MAANTTAQDLERLEGVRKRLTNLAVALQNLTGEIHNAQPLMPWPQFYDSFNHIVHDLQLLTEYIQKNQTFLDSAHIYPLPSFPGVEHEALLGQLLQKKLDAQVESWLADAGSTSQTQEGTTGTTRETDTLSSDERRQLFKSASAAPKKSLVDIPLGLDYTVAEHISGLENVETGLHRELRHLNSDVKAMAKNEKKMEEKPGMRLEDIMRFMTRGELPAGGGLALE